MVLPRPVFRFQGYGIYEERVPQLAALPEKLYLSLGDKEAQTRNQIMAKVEQNTGDLHEYYKSLGIDTIFELNEGNHFKDAGLRIAKAITWITD